MTQNATSEASEEHDQRNDACTANREIQVDNSYVRLDIYLTGDERSQLSTTNTISAPSRLEIRLVLARIYAALKRGNKDRSNDIVLLAVNLLLCENSRALGGRALGGRA